MRPFHDIQSHPLFFSNRFKMKHDRSFLAMDHTASLGRTHTHVVPLTKNLKNFIYPAILIVGLVMGDAVFSMPDANAQALNLGNRSGQTSLQSSTGTGVLNTCLNLPSDKKTNLQQDLSNVCTSLALTGQRIDGGTSNPQFDLGLTNSELNAALQQVAVEEVLAPRTQATKTFNGQLQALGSRLAALRLGAGGISVAGLNLNGLNMQAGLSPQSMNFLGFPQRGGGASGDSGGGEFSRLSAFINGVISTGDKDASNRENGFDFDSQGVTVGVDYRFLDELILGSAFSYSHFDADFKSSSVNSGGNNKSDGYVFSLYGTYYLENFYLEGTGSVGWNDHDSKRKIVVPSKTTVAPINRTAEGDTHSTQYSFSLGTGYNAQVGSFDFGPYARLTYLKIGIDGFKESGAGGLNLAIEDQDVKSLMSALGLRASKKFSWKWGVWSPQIRGEWNHEYENDAKTTTTKYVNDPNNNPLFLRNESPDRDFFRVGATLANVSVGGTQAFFDYETMLGFRDISNHIFTIGARQEF